MWCYVAKFQENNRHKNTNFWWNIEGMYYKLFKPIETVTDERYALWLKRLDKTIQEKRPYSSHGW